MNYFNPFQQNYDNMYSYNTVPQVVKVNGYNGANAYQLPPNASALLLDETQPIVWLVKSDGAGTNPFCHQTTTTPTTTG